MIRPLLSALLCLLAIIPAAGCEDDKTDTPSDTPGATPPAEVNAPRGSTPTRGSEAPDGGTEENPVVQQNTPMLSSAVP